jgi:hypothetical protein
MERIPPGLTGDDVLDILDHARRASVVLRVDSIVPQDGDEVQVAYQVLDSDEEPIMEGDRYWLVVANVANFPPNLGVGSLFIIEGGQGES